MQKNIKSQSNFEMQSFEIKENQNNEIPFTELLAGFEYLMAHVQYLLSVNHACSRDLRHKRSEKSVATVPDFIQSQSGLFFLIIFALIWGKSTTEED